MSTLEGTRRDVGTTDQAIHSSDRQPGASPATEDDCRLQDGIYFRSGQRPGRCYRLLLLNARPGASQTEARDAIAMVWERAQAVRHELVADLQPARLRASGTSDPPRDPELTCLLGYGAPLFERFPGLRRPGELGRTENRPKPFPRLSRVPEADRSVGEADLALQFIAGSELAVVTAVAEVWMLIRTKGLKLDVATLYGGFNREDRRSWLGFHDGIGNIEGERRREAIETKLAVSRSEDPPWMDGGTYMGFLRLAIDLEVWRSLSLHEQESYVGRERGTGCPLTRIDSGSRQALEGCPVPNGPDSVDYRNPQPPSLDPDNRAQWSHMHRTNLNRPRGAIADGDNRIFRQSYEFLEPLPGGRLRPGVNFVSFQRRLSCLTNILITPGWLGNANFGGKDSSRDLISLIGGGYYAVPPRGGPFPGAGIF
jgi:deferrochelatase/peroxidase EfeB